MKDNKKINYDDINEITNTGKKILKILYLLLIVLGIYALTLINKEWGVFRAIWSIIKVISPLFIGVIIAYLINPIINRMTSKKKMNRAVATSIVFITFSLFTDISILEAYSFMVLMLFIYGK